MTFCFFGRYHQFVLRPTQGLDTFIFKNECVFFLAFAHTRDSPIPYAVRRQNMKNYDIDFENMTDEEIDEFYRPRKTNNRRTLAPLFVHMILKEKSSPEKHLSQNEIIDILSEDPYEIQIERKALGRVLHLLADSGLGVVSNPRYGAWYDPEEEWAGIRHGAA